jgi:arsenite-transporting ATPase
LLLISLWGKGGVGKSTIAAALSVIAASSGKNILLLSTDPVPATKRLLCGDKEAETGKAVCGGIEVIELSEEDVKRLWIKRFGDEVYEVVSSFLPVDKWIVDYVAGAPGIADQFLLYYVYELVRSGRYDVIVWDTVAAGGSIRMLRIEEELYTHMGDAAKLYLRVKGVLDRIRRGRRDPLELIDEWRRLARGILDMLASSIHRPLLIAEPTELAAAVTMSVYRELCAHNVIPRGLVINKVLMENPCKGCSLLEEVVEEHKNSMRSLDEIKLRKYIVPFVEARGFKRIEAVAASLEKQGIWKYITS